MNIHFLAQQLEIKPILFQLQENPIIYFLTKQEEVVYIGVTSSKRLFNRISEHSKDKDFSKVHYFNVLMDRKDAENLESGLISLVNPKYNNKDSETKPELIREVLNKFKQRDRIHDLEVIEKTVVINSQYNSVTQLIIMAIKLFFQKINPFSKYNSIEETLKRVNYENSFGK